MYFPSVIFTYSLMYLTSTRSSVQSAATYPPEEYVTEDIPKLEKTKSSFDHSLIKKVNLENSFNNSSEDGRKNFQTDVTSQSDTKPGLSKMCLRCSGSQEAVFECCVTGQKCCKTVIEFCSDCDPLYDVYAGYCCTHNKTCCAERGSNARNGLDSKYMGMKTGVRW